MKSNHSDGDSVRYVHYVTFIFLDTSSNVHLKLNVVVDFMGVSLLWGGGDNKNKNKKETLP